MGYVARYVFTRLPKIIEICRGIFNAQDHNEWPLKIGKSIPKKKGDIAYQRQLFLQFCGEGGDVVLTHIQRLCIEYFTKQQQKQEDESKKRKIGEASEGAVNMDDLNDNFVARVAHIAVEEGTKDIMHAIFACESSRLTLDDKQLRVSALWEKIATDFFNAPGWNLELFNKENFGEAGVNYIDPYNFTSHPQEQFTGSNIRVAFNKLKTIYTIVHTNFKASGRNEGGGTEFEDGIEADDLFYENFARTRFPAHARKLLYAHLLWGKAPPAFCLRTLPEDKHSQVGVKGTNESPVIHALDKKALKLQEFANTLVKGLNPELKEEDKQLQTEATQSQIARDKEIKRFYCARAEEVELANMRNKPKYHISQFHSLFDMMVFMGFAEEKAQLYSTTLISKGYATPLSLIFADRAALTSAGMLEGEVSLVMGILAATAWG